MELANEIRDKAAALTGKEDPLYEALSPVVTQMILAQLPKDTSVESCKTAVICAGAFTVLSFAQSLGANELAGFDAGTLKLAFREHDDSYAQIAKQIMAPWCHDSAAFCGVRA